MELRREAELSRAKAAQWERTSGETEQECEQLRTKVAEQSKLEDKAMRAEELELEVTALRWEQSKSAAAFGETIRNLEARLAAECEAQATLEARAAEAEELAQEAAEARQERDAGIASEKQCAAQVQQHVVLLQAKGERSEEEWVCTKKI